MDARLRRIASDYEQIKKDFAGHKNIIVTPIGDEPPEKYHVTYFVNGIYLQPDGRIETLSRHEVEITLHAEYPRYKPICKILTPIWHPNFRDGQICIGDIWGAGESLTDIIINIGDMIQYKSWNSYSPLSADAAAWAMDNKHLFPVGNIDLYVSDYASAKDDVEIDLFAEDGSVIEEKSDDQAHIEEVTQVAVAPTRVEDVNDFEITAEELEGIEYVPIAERMQGPSATAASTVKVKINFKTILVKGILWALIGAFIGFEFGEICEKTTSNSGIASMLGYKDLAKYFKYQDKVDELQNQVYDLFKQYCEENNIDPDDDDAFTKWLSSADDTSLGVTSDYYDAYQKANKQLFHPVSALSFPSTKLFYFVTWR